MKSRMLLSLLRKIGSWKKLFLCGKKSLEKPTVELPREIIEWEILPRLPAESLYRFTRVCKQWKSHMSTCEFIRKNLEHNDKETLTHRKVVEINNLTQTFRTRYCDDLNNYDSTIVRSLPFINKAQQAPHVLLLASLDGLVLVKLLKTYNNEYALWNPLTGAYKKLSNSLEPYLGFDAVCLYFDSNEKDYKVLQWSCFGGAFKTRIYSQRLNLTKETQWSEKHQIPYEVSWSSNPISLGESLYFMGNSFGGANRNQYWITVFDVKSEKMKEIRFPLLNQENQYCYASLIVIKGCIHIFAIRCMKMGGELWRMDGDDDGWTKVKDIPPASNHPWTYDDDKIDMYYKRYREIVYLETLVSPSC